MKQALAHALDWTFESGSYHKNTDDGTRITLRAHEMLALLDANIFSVSMNRVRLLLAFDRRTTKLAQPGARVGGLVRWGLLTRDGEPTPIGHQVLDGRRRWSLKIEKARQLLATAPFLFGAKCAALPFDF